jgi:hypothetical protein
MKFDVDRFSSLNHRLDISGIDFGAFREEPLPAPVLRCLRYMHDVEHHSVCYLRDLLVTRAHRDSEVTTFLTIWNYEEHWHGEAIGQVLAAHGEPANGRRVASFRRRLGVRDQVRPMLTQLTSMLSGHVIALHMSWGAVNEWTTQAGYARLAERAGHPVLSELLRRIMRQEGRHIDFYMSEAEKRLGASRNAQRVTRAMLSKFWAPVGSGIMPPDDVRFLVMYLFGGPDGLVSAQRIDRRIAALPGLGELTLVRRAVEGLAMGSGDDLAVPVQC